MRGYTPVNEIYVAARNSGWDGLLERAAAHRARLRHRAEAPRRRQPAGQAAIARHRPNADHRPERVRRVHAPRQSPARRTTIKLRNKLVFLSLDLLYSKAPDADVLMFLQDNGMTREEFMWFMEPRSAGFQVMGNDYYGHNEKLLLPDGTIMYGEDVLGWYLDHAPLLPPLLQARDAHRNQHARSRQRRPRWLWKQWTNVLRMRRDGIPVLGFTWYSLTDQMDWDTQLAREARPGERLRALRPGPKAAPGGRGVPAAHAGVRADHRAGARRDVRADGACGAGPGEYLIRLLTGPASALPR